MKNISNIHDYCREINISPPKHSFFDIRQFEENMKTVNTIQPPFRHEFYAIALRILGNNKEVNGKFLDSNLFFNSPYQIITWDIKPDWQGWYIIFDRQFLALNDGWKNFMSKFPFFRLDKVLHMNLLKEDAIAANSFFQKIFDEYHSENKDKFLFIQALTQLLLLLSKRYFDKTELTHENSTANRTTDIVLLSRFQCLVSTMLTNEDSDTKARKTSFYADKLHVHPNYLNTVVKRITGNTASDFIQSQLISSAKSLLIQTQLSSKEVAYKLHFEEPTHFNAFFKKNTGMTPQQFRERKQI